MPKDKTLHGEILPPAKREVGLRIGDQVFMPALPPTADGAAALNGYLRAHNMAVSLLDQYFVCREQYRANRNVIYRPTADVAAQEEEESELKHQRELASIRREREIDEHKLAALQSRHKLEAEEEFKVDKFNLGKARFGEKAAKHRVGETVAKASVHDYAPAAEKPAAPSPEQPPLVDALLQGIEDLEQQIEQREASGMSADTLHMQRDALRDLVMQTLKKGRA
jgi:hypothetical protein